MTAAAQADPHDPDPTSHRRRPAPDARHRALVDRWLAVRAARGGVRAADGALVCRSDLSGRPQAWRVAADGTWPQPLTAVDRVEGLLAHPDDAGVVVARVDVGGDERSQVHRVRLPGGGAVGLTDRRDAVHQPGAITADGGGVLTCATRRDGVDFDLWHVPLDGGEPRLIAELPGVNAVVEALPGGGAVVWHRASSMRTSVRVLRPDGTRALSWGDDEAARHLTVGTVPDGGWLAVSDRGSDWLRLGALDAQGRWSPFADAPDADVDDAATRDGLAAWTVNDGGRSRLRLADADRLCATGFAAAAEVALPTGVVEDLHVPDGGAEALFTFSGPRHPANVWSVDAASLRAAPLTAVPTGGVDLAAAPEPTLHHVPAHDGETIPLWLTRPAGVARPPVVTWLHGGPEAQARPQLDPFMGLLVDAGYAVAQPNVRGSTGYGRRYAALDDRERRFDAIRDAGTVGAWLADRDDVDGARVAVGGASYGGYLTLATLVAEPDRWAAGIDVVGIADLETFLERTADYRRAVREAEYGALDRDRDVLRALSPIHRVERITAPLLVLHGRNDPRVPVGEAEQVTAALRERGRPVELVVYDDEGHGFAKDANRRDAWARVVGFLDRHLGG